MLFFIDFGSKADLPATHMHPHKVQVQVSLTTINYLLITALARTFYWVAEQNKQQHKLLIIPIISILPLLTNFLQQE